MVHFVTDFPEDWISERELLMSMKEKLRVRFTIFGLSLLFLSCALQYFYFSENITSFRYSRVLCAKNDRALRALLTLFSRSLRLIISCGNIIKGQ